MVKYDCMYVLTIVRLLNRMERVWKMWRRLAGASRELSLRVRVLLSLLLEPGKFVGLSLPSLASRYAASSDSDDNNGEHEHEHAVVWWMESD